MTAALVCLVGAAIGVIVGFVAARIGLPIALRSQRAAASAGRLPAPFKDPDRLERLTRLVYRYMFPLVFGGVGAVAAYTTWFGRTGQ
ncbi:hypothetical protein GGR24_003057 [Hansschlegelia beijingensis]|uniref:Uncharacterized protein n=1 Tax=Hansschlegelia beijingensis TaxID=1133344 RepID=A0A7W6D0B7_9HYPH|nr:hypothetical protein [Hansschlegelia beijingensis]